MIRASRQYSIVREFCYLDSGKYKQADLKFSEALRLERSSPFTQQATLAATLDDFALNQIQLGRYAQAKSLARESLAIRRSLFPDNHPTIARTLSMLSYLGWLTGKIDDALTFAREASQITIANGLIDEAGKFRLQRHLLILSSKTASSASQEETRALTEEAFSIGQQAIRSDTASTVARTALRFSTREPHLRELLKEVDDLDRSSAVLEQALTHSATLISDQSTQSFGEFRSRLFFLANQRKSKVTEIEKSFPDYARLVDPKPLSTKVVEELLEPNEALIAFVVGFEDVYIWCVTKETVTWRKLDLPPHNLETTVAVLRASLDVEPEYSGDLKKALFDLGQSYALYTQLIEPILAPLNAKTKLLVVPSGPMIGLPLQLLVSSPPKIPKPTRDQPQAFKAADWLIKRFAISVIPSVETLQGLRGRAKPTTDRKPLIGFANPLPSPEFLSPGEASVALATPVMRGVRSGRGLPPSVAEKHDVDALREFLAGHLLKQLRTRVGRSWPPPRGR